MKTGRLSKEEKRIIGRLADSMTPEDIAQQLDRRVDSVETYIKDNLKLGITDVEMAQYDLEDRPYYFELQAQFSEGELQLFRYHWAKLISQFNKDDILSTEEMQIVDLIKMEILSNRSLNSQKNNTDQLNQAERDLAAQREMDEIDQDRDFMISLQRNIASLKAAQEALSKEYRELATKKQSMFREVKGTREQRIKRLEDSKQSFTSWVASLMQDPELIKSYGIEMEKMRQAMEKEKERLSAFHKYEDDVVDQPFLTPDTVKDE